MSVENEKPDKTIDSLQGERSLPSVNTAKRSKNNSLAIVFAVFALLLTGIYGYFSFFSKSKKEEEIIKPLAIDTGRNLNIKWEDELEIPPVTPPVVAEVEKKAPKKDPSPRVVKPPPIIIDHSSSGLMISSKDKKVEKAANDSKGKDKGVSDPDRSKLGEKLVAVKTEKAAAGQINNRDFVITKGTVINCSLQTQIDTSVPGFISCVTTRDVYSDTGTVLLLERGSQVVGEYQSNVDNGLTRLYILWSRVKTPNGVVVDLNSPSADPLGGAGTDGFVKSRFWKRFGAAMLLSIVDEAYTTATDMAKINLTNKADRKDRKDRNSPERFEEQMQMQIRVQQMQMEQAKRWAEAGLDPDKMPQITIQQDNYGYSNNSERPQYDFGSGTSPFRDVISAVLSKQASIPDVMTKNRGEKVAIFVARDLDFSGVYDVGTE